MILFEKYFINFNYQIQTYFFPIDTTLMKQSNLYSTNWNDITKQKIS